jgi:cytochrome c5
MSMLSARGCVGRALVLALALAGVSAQAQRHDPTFAHADYFRGMDSRIALGSAELRGRNTWLMWTAGNQAFWDYLAGQSFGTFDLLKTIDSRERPRRFATFGLMNEPGVLAATAPDRYGLWIDRTAGAEAPYAEIFSQTGFLRTYGRSTGIIGLRLFTNPKFDAAARRRWDPVHYRDDLAYYSDPNLVRPYLVGMSCAFCHVGPNPVAPPADPENPRWENLSSYIGAQYWHAAPIFSFKARPDNFFYQVLAAMPPGTVDTSALTSDNINNPRNMNAIYSVGARLAIAQPERLAGGNLDMSGTSPTMPVPHVLKDGADSIGLLGALARVYLSIGAFHEEWLKHFNLLVGGTPQTPIRIAVARDRSPYWRATLDRLPDVAAFFLAAARPQPLEQAPGGAHYLTEDDATVSQGKRIFAKTCAACHSSKLPDPPAGVSLFSPAWDDWTHSQDFADRMTALVLAPDFLVDNFLSTDRRYPITRIGTNACASLATNALRGHIWDNFSSETYKALPAVGTIEVNHPLTGAPIPHPMPDGGRGYMRAPSLISIWASAPYFRDNSLGHYVHDPSVAARMEAFQDAIEKLLWPNRRLGMGSVYRTTAESWLVLDRDALPPLLFEALRAGGVIGPQDRALRIGPIPQGTPINLLANTDLELSARNAPRLVKLALDVNAALRDIKARGLAGAAATARLQDVVPDLLAASKCPDFIADRGHLFGAQLSDDHKRALIAFLKRM